MGQIQERYENYVRRGLMEEVVARAFYGLDGWLEAPPKILRTLDDRMWHLAVSPYERLRTWWRAYDLGLSPPRRGSGNWYAETDTRSSNRDG